ncbi:transcriptional regulator, TetR family [Microbacterium sp. RURRCA19A]|nr:transcriptional regulator, TetR family [Microbacterium sp. RURRCA19A]
MGLRERTRRAVQAELIDVAQRLFVEQGYENTTIEQIADEAGISKRSFFRYFATKEAVVLAKYDKVGDDLVEALEARPIEEPLWLSLRHIFDAFVEYAEDEDRASRSAEIDRVVNSSDALRGAYLGRLEHIQNRLTEAAARRARLDGAEHLPNIAPRALVGAAFSAIYAAGAEMQRCGRSFGDCMDLAMNAIDTYTITITRA